MFCLPFFNYPKCKTCCYTPEQVDEYLLNKTDDLQKQINNIDTGDEGLEQRVTILEEKVVKLGTNYAEHETRIDDLEMKYEDQSAELSSLKQRTDDLETSYSAVVSSLSNIDDRVKKLEAEKDDYEYEIKSGNKYITLYYNDGSNETINSYLGNKTIYFKKLETLSDTQILIVPFDYSLQLFVDGKYKIYYFTMYSYTQSYNDGVIYLNIKIKPLYDQSYNEKLINYISFSLQISI